MNNPLRKDKLRAFVRSVKTKGGRANAFLRKVSSRTISSFRRFLGTGWRRISILGLVIVICVAGIIVYARRLPTNQANVTTVQSQPARLQLKPKDKALDQERIWTMIKPQLMLFGLVGVVPLVGFTIWAARTRVRHRSTVMLYGVLLMFAALALIGANYITDVLAFQALTDSGYPAFQKHNGMLFWLFAFLPGGLGVSIFANAITSREA
jgi:hypothetical protein